MQGKMTRIVMLLILLLPISSFSMVDAIFNAGVGAGIFVVITLFAVIAYVLSKIVTNKEIKK
jgi:hypothetical protein